MTEIVAAEFAVPISVHLNEPGRKIEDPHGDYAPIREVGENDPLLVEVEAQWEPFELEILSLEIGR